MNDGSLIGEDPVIDAVQAFRMGRPALVNDRENPERGGVVAIAGRHASDDTINFMATHARGLTCMALPPERVERLGLTLQGPESLGLRRENYTVSIEARTGVTTGISAADRARTIQVASDRRTRPEDLVTPGHVHPALAQDGGVFSRTGWAEAVSDLSRLAGLDPVGAFCQVLDDAGEIATGRALDHFAALHDLPLVGLADIVAHRMANETFVTQLAQATLPTAYGDFVARPFMDELAKSQHVAFTMGDLRSSDTVLVRLHSECLTGDVFGSRRCDCGGQLAEAMRLIAMEGTGALLYLRQEGRGIGLANKVRAYALQEQGHDTVEANHQLGFPADQRDFGVGAQMLLALGVRKVRLLTNNPRKVAGLERFGIEVVSREPLEIEHNEQAAHYLRTKKRKMGHILTKV